MNKTGLQKWVKNIQNIPAGTLKQKTQSKRSIKAFNQVTQRSHVWGTSIEYILTI